MYSQYDEEKHILAACDATKQGRFLDVGAWNAKTFSNTRALFERGWSGVLIEPSPEPFLALLKEYGNEPRILLILAAVGFERNCVKLHASADAVSTTRDQVYRQWRDAATYQGDFWVPQITFGELFNQFGGPFNFVNLDTEGTSVDLLLSLDLSNLLPRAVCVEHDGRVAECIEHGQRHGYRAVYVNGTNLVLAQ